MHALAVRRRRGFTLVEMLVVIVIISIIAGLLLGTLYAVRPIILAGMVKSEISQLDMSLTNYASKFTELPPDFGPPSVGSPAVDPLIVRAKEDEVVRHLRKAFPKYTPKDTGGATLFERFANDVRNNYGFTIDPRKFDQTSALVFFLGGLPEKRYTAGDVYIPAGFHTDPSQPFKPGLPRTKPLFEFKHKQIKVTGGKLQYFPGPIDAPYVYFKSRRIQGDWQYRWTNGVTPTPTKALMFYQHAASNVCVPYCDSENPPGWRNHDTYQIIAAGLDDEFCCDERNVGDPVLCATLRVSKTAENFTKSDYDNITNFTEGSTLEAETE